MQKTYEFILGEEIAMKRIYVIVLDSVGIGELPDARLYGDEPVFLHAEHEEAGPV